MATVYPDRPAVAPVTVRLAEPGEDRELKAIAYINSIFSDFSPAAKQRMLAYLNLRHDPAPELSEV